MDAIIQKAIEQRDWHKTQIARLEAFLATYFELSGEGAALVDARTDAEKVEAPRARIVSRPRGGVGGDTLDAAAELIRGHGPLSTRDLLPLIQAKGIKVGGKNQIATLSARLSNKGVLEVHHGKWRFIESAEQNLGPSGSKEEAAGFALESEPAASVSRSNEGGSDMPPP